MNPTRCDQCGRFVKQGHVFITGDSYVNSGQICYRCGLVDSIAKSIEGSIRCLEQLPEAMGRALKNIEDKEPEPDTNKKVVVEADVEKPEPPKNRRGGFNL